MKLIVFETFYHKSVFCNALQIPEHGFAHFFQDNSVCVEKHNSEYCSLVTKDWKKIMAVKIENIKSVIIVCTRAGCFVKLRHWTLASNVSQLNDALGDGILDVKAKSKIKCGIYELHEPLPIHPKIRIRLDTTNVREVKRIKSQECVSCKEETPTILFICGHQSLCKDCYKLWGTNCPICKATNDTVIIDK